MPDWKKPDHPPEQIDVLLFDAFSALCLANTIEPLRAANGFAGRTVYKWRFLTLDGAAVSSSSNLRVTADGALKDANGDMLIVMPSYRYLVHDSAATRRALRSAAGRYKTLAGFDTGSWLLASAGLLDRRRATIHWDELDRFAEAFPDVQAERADHVLDGNLITCRGAQAAFELMLDRIADRHGQAARLDVAGLFAVGEGEPQRARLSRNRVVARALAVMQANLERPLGIAELARRIGRGQKDLEQRFRRDLDAPPRTVYRRLRLVRARALITETDLPVSEVALRCGYTDASAMTRAFRGEFGTTPRALRA